MTVYPLSPLSVEDLMRMLKIAEFIAGLEPAGEASM
jgi:hypothetical protein